MKIKFNIFFLKLLFILITVLNSSAYAENKKINKSINELRTEGFQVLRATVANGSWYVFLEKKAMYQFDNESGEIKKKTDIEFISCVFNDIKTVCYIP